MAVLTPSPCQLSAWRVCPLGGALFTPRKISPGFNKPAGLTPSSPLGNGVTHASRGVGPRASDLWPCVSGAEKRLWGEGGGYGPGPPPNGSAQVLPSAVGRTSRGAAASARELAPGGPSSGRPP